jgi:hypothetical protein
VDVGNNRAGRKGKMRCDACRRVKSKVGIPDSIKIQNRLLMSKCIYESVSSPCEYCLKHNFKAPCTKRWGPKRQKCELEDLPPSSQVAIIDVDPSSNELVLSSPANSSPTIGAAIEPENIFILNWLYVGNVQPIDLRHSDGKCNTGVVSAMQSHLLSFTKSLLPIYNAAVTSSSLRYALLAFAGMVTSRGSLALREEDNLTRARFVLRTKTEATLEEADLFASFLLAFVSWARPISEPKEYKTHLKGFVTLLKHFASRNDGSYALKRFWPMARDLLLSVPYFRMSGCPDSIWFNLYDGCRQALGPPTFAQCLAYRDDDWAIRDHLHYHARILSRAFFASVAPQTDDPIDTINTAIENIRDDLQAIEEYIAQHYSATVEQFIKISDSHMLSQCSLATVLEYQVCKLYLTMLDTPDGNVLEGMQKADTIKEALWLVQMLSKVAKFCQQVEGRWALNFSDVCDQMFMFVLVLAALALPREVVLHLHIANGTSHVEFF